MEEHFQHKVKLKLKSTEHGRLSVTMNLMKRMQQLSVQCLDLVGKTQLLTYCNTYTAQAVIEH